MLCDFGLSTLFEETSGLTTTKTIRGTYRYFSPELIEDGARHTQQSDMWAWGCLAFQVDSVYFLGETSLTHSISRRV